MNVKIVALKAIASCLILALMVLVGYGNFVITWGLEVKSWLGFFGFFLDDGSSSCFTSCFSN